ncbi:MAG: DUF4153 domain-containing protein [Tissierellia bacterium]|nr:DUF4153 domain-containing protein [Tissierellia bacterium]
MKFLKKITSTLTNAKFSFHRFPIVMVSALLSAFFFSLAIDNDGMGNDRDLNAILGYVFLSGIFIYSFVALLSEGLIHNAKDREDVKHYRMFIILAYLLSIPLVYILYDLIYEETGGYLPYQNKYIFFGILFSLAIGCTYISKIFYHKDFVPFVVKIIQSFLTAMVYSLILYAGISGIIFALVHLFGLDLSITIYSKMALFTFIPFFVGIFLSSFPKVNESLMDYRYGKPVSVLLVYLMLPIHLVYLVILFLYFAKIIIMQELPEGIIVNLILWYGLVATFFNFFLSHIKGHKMIDLFRRIFSIVMLPILAMMFFAIFLRVKEYGLTENRYFVIIGGCWILLSCLYYIFYRKNSNIVIPIVLSLLILVSSTGPLSAYHLSARSQNRKFIKILQQNSMINGNQIIPKSEISKEDKKNLTGIIEYMNRHHRKHELSYLPKDFEMSDENMREVFGFDPYYGRDDNHLIYYTDQNFSIDISGYKKMIRVDSMSRHDGKTEFGAYQVYQEGSHIIIDYVLEDQEIQLADINIKEVEDKLRTLKNTVSIINPEDLAIKGESGGINYKIIFTEINIYSETQKNDNTFYAAFYLLTDRED